MSQWAGTGAGRPREQDSFLLTEVLGGFLYVGTFTLLLTETFETFNYENY